MTSDDYYAGYGQARQKPDLDRPGEHASQPDPFADYPSVDHEQRTRIGPSDSQSTSPDATQLTQKTPPPLAEPCPTPGDFDALAPILAELDQLIGLQRVKYEIRRLLHYVRVKEMRRAQGIGGSQMALHSVFYGSPGTGKTTVARLYGRMLKALGLLTGGHLIETDRSGLVGAYIGQTEGTTDAKIQQALGGVLFIDEAYALSKGEHAQWDYGAEVIQVLVKRMEDHRDDLVVIVAGYPEPMNRFLESNEGLRSRFSTYIHFDDYSPEELLEIFRLFCHQEEYELHDEAAELALAAIKYHYELRDKTFGNARYAHNLFETVIRNHAMRIGLTPTDPTVTDLRLIRPEDVPLLTDMDMA